MRTFTQIKASGEITAKELEHYGLNVRELTVVRFLDASEELRWFMRQHEELGTVRALCDGLTPVDQAEVLRTAHAAFGSCSVLW